MLTIVALMFVFNIIMRKWLKVEESKLFSYNHVNEQHKKIDWTIKISFIVILSLGYFYNVARDLEEKVWYFETWFILYMFIIISGVVCAIMEWKYSENRKRYIFTISQLVFILIILGVIFTTEFFGLF